MRSIALDALCAGVPSGHVTGRVQLKDRVIDHGFDQSAISCLARQKFAVGLLTFCDVACHLGKADQLTSLIANGVDDDGCPEAAPIFADSPSFRAETAGLGCNLQGGLREPVSAILWGLKR